MPSSFRFPSPRDVGPGPAYRWWTEGSAQWAMDKVYPPLREEHDQAIHMLSASELSLDLSSDPHMYSSYLLPYYYYRKGGSTNATWVRQAWESCKTMNAVKAVDGALTGGFDKIWPEVALHNWNAGPVADYKGWDGMENRPTKYSQYPPVALGNGSDREYTITYDLPKLSTTYEHYTFPDSRVRSVMFWNGATFDLQKGMDSPISPYWKVSPAPASATEGVRVQALIKIGDQWQAPADWTDEPSHTFCRDLVTERIEELVVIISNSQFLDPGKRAKPPGQDPRLSVSNMGCYKWKGTMSMTLPGESTLTVNVTDVTWTRQPAAPGDPNVSYRATGSVTSTLSGKCSGSYGPVAIQPFPSIMWTINYVPPDSAGRRAFSGAGSEPPTPITVSCPGGPAVFPFGGPWFVSPSPPVFRLVDPSGTRIHDSWLVGTATFTVDLTSQPEP